MQTFATLLPLQWTEPKSGAKRRCTIQIILLESHNPNFQRRARNHETLAQRHDATTMCFTNEGSNRWKNVMKDVVECVFTLPHLTNRNL